MPCATGACLPACPRGRNPAAVLASLSLSLCLFIYSLPRIHLFSYSMTDRGGLGMNIFKASGEQNDATRNAEAVYFPLPPPRPVGQLPPHLYSEVSGVSACHAGPFTRAECWQPTNPSICLQHHSPKARKMEAWPKPSFDGNLGLKPLRGYLRLYLSPVNVTIHAFCCRNVNALHCEVLPQTLPGFHALCSKCACVASECLQNGEIYN